MTFWVFKPFEKFEVKMKERFSGLFGLKIDDWVFALSVNLLMKWENMFRIFLLHRKRLMPSDQNLGSHYVELWLQEQLYIDYPLLWKKVHILFVDFQTSILLKEVQCKITSALKTKTKFKDTGTWRLLPVQII